MHREAAKQARGARLELAGKVHTHWNRKCCQEGLRDPAGGGGHGPEGGPAPKPRPPFPPPRLKAALCRLRASLGDSGPLHHHLLSTPPLFPPPPPPPPRPPPWTPPCPRRRSRGGALRARCWWTRSGWPAPTSGTGRGTSPPPTTTTAPSSSWTTMAGGRSAPWLLATRSGRTPSCPGSGARPGGGRPAPAQLDAC